MHNSNLLYDLWSKTSDYSHPHGQVFVFDCDKTLITGDIGDASLRSAIQHRWTISHDAWWRHFDVAEIATPHQRASWRKAYESSTQNSDMMGTKQTDSLSDELWTAYECLCAIDVHSAYVYAARFAYQRTSDEIAQLTRHAFSKDTTTHLRPFIFAFIDTLQKLGGQVWVVSSSQIDVIRVIGDYYNVPAPHIVGIDFMRDPSTLRLSENLIQPIPIDTGKVDAFFTYQLNQPALMVGDSFYDLPLMAAAQHRFLIDHHQSADLTLAAKSLGAEIIDHSLLEQHALH